MHHTPRAQAVRRAQDRARAEVADMPYIVRASVGGFIYAAKEARYEREEMRALKQRKIPHPEG